MRSLKKNTGKTFTNNLHVLVLVSVDYHPLYGLSVSVLDIDSNFMLGILEQQRNATLERLVKENDYILKEGDGYSTYNSRLQLPAVIQRVAVISSSSSARNWDRPPEKCQYRGPDGPYPNQNTHQGGGIYSLPITAVLSLGYSRSSKILQ